MIDFYGFYIGRVFAFVFKSLVFLKEISKKSSNRGVYNET